MHGDHDGILELDGEVLFFGAIGIDAVVVQGHGAVFTGTAGLVELGAGLIQMLGHGQGMMDALAGGQAGVGILGDFHPVVHGKDDYLVLLVAALGAITLDFALILAFDGHVCGKSHSAS